MIATPVQVYLGRRLAPAGNRSDLFNRVLHQIEEPQCQSFFGRDTRESFIYPESPMILFLKFGEDLPVGYKSFLSFRVQGRLEQLHSPLLLPKRLHRLVIDDAV